jgi:CBS domain containing-hemolysin-like protein
MTLLVLYLSLALGVSFLCSLLEAVLLSITPSYEAALQTDQPALGDLLAGLRDEIDRPLAAILILNTVAHTVGAAGVGAQAAAMYGSSYLAVASAILTLLILVLSEIIPKTLGATYWRRFTPFTARCLKWMIVCLYPLVVVSRALSKLISRGAADESTVSRAELGALAQVAGEEGVVDETESRVFRNLLRFRSVVASDIMTPRQVLVAFDATTTIDQAVADERRLQFSRFPVYEGTIENITGFVLKHDLLMYAANDEDDVQVGALKRPIQSLPEGSRLTELLDSMLAKKEHIVLLTEELGGTAGIVTLEDVMETLLGVEIVDETDRAVDMRELARQKWTERAERLGLNTPATGFKRVDLGDDLD